MSGSFLSLDYVPSGFIIQSLYFPKLCLLHALLVGHLLWIKFPQRQGRTHPFTRGGEFTLLPKCAHTHHTRVPISPPSAHIPNVHPPCVPSQTCPQAHTLNMHANLSHHTHPTHAHNLSAIHSPHTPTHTHIPHLHLPYTSTPHARTCVTCPSPAAHTHSHTHKNHTITRLPHPICPVHTQTGPHTCHALARKTPPQQQALPPPATNAERCGKAPSPKPWEEHFFLLTGSPLFLGGTSEAARSTQSRAGWKGLPIHVVRALELQEELNFL